VHKQQLNEQFHHFFFAIPGSSRTFVKAIEAKLADYVTNIRKLTTRSLTLLSTTMLTQPLTPTLTSSLIPSASSPTGSVIMHNYWRSVSRQGENDIKKPARRVPVPSPATYNLHLQPILATQYSTSTLTQSLTQSQTRLIRNSLFYSPRFWKIRRELFLELNNLKADNKTQQKDGQWLSLHNTRKREIASPIEIEFENRLETDQFTFAIPGSHGAFGKTMEKKLAGYVTNLGKLTARSLTRLSTKSLIQSLVAKRLNKSFEQTFSNVGLPTGPPETEAGKQALFPDLPGFERERLELRYTSAFYLAGTQDSERPHRRMKEPHLMLPAKLWLSSKTGIASGTEPSPIENFMRKGREQGTSTSSLSQRTIDLSSLAGDNDFNRHSHSAMTHFSPADNKTSEIRFNEIEKTIATHAKQLENRLKDVVKTSGAESAFTGSTAVQPGVKLSNLADGVYKMILDRIKRERSMRGY
jgi:hypothetical protein